MRIYKFALDKPIITGETPPIKKFLFVAVQNDIPCIWAEVDTASSEREGYVFQIVGTGHDVPLVQWWTHIGSFSVDNWAMNAGQNFVGHVYYQKGNKQINPRLN